MPRGLWWPLQDNDHIHIACGPWLRYYCSFIRSRAMDNKSNWWRNKYLPQLCCCCCCAQEFRVAPIPPVSFSLSVSDKWSHSNTRAITRDLCAWSLSSGDPLRPRGIDKLAKKGCRPYHRGRHTDMWGLIFFPLNVLWSTSPIRKQDQHNLLSDRLGRSGKVIGKV